MEKDAPVTDRIRKEKTWFSSRRFRKPYLHNILRRQRINNFLNQRAGRKLTVIQAKAGQGNQYCSQTLSAGITMIFSG